jgi:hypothetical protein
MRAKRGKEWEKNVTVTLSNDVGKSLVIRKEVLGHE